MFLLFLCVPLFQQYNLSRIDDAQLFQDKSSQDLPYYNELHVQMTLGFPTARETFETPFRLQRSFRFTRIRLYPLSDKSCTATAYLWLCRDSHPSLNTLRSAVIKSPNFSFRGTASPVRFLQRALVLCLSGTEYKYCASLVFTFKIAALSQQSFRKKFALHHSAPSLQHNVAWNRFPAHHQVNVLPLVLIAACFENFCCAATGPTLLSLGMRTFSTSRHMSSSEFTAPRHQKPYFRQLLHRHLWRSFGILSPSDRRFCSLSQSSGSLQLLRHLARRFESLFPAKTRSLADPCVFSPR